MPVCWCVRRRVRRPRADHDLQGTVFLRWRLLQPPLLTCARECRQTGKHGHAKANITALDIFTGAKLMDVQPTSHNVDAPFVVNTLYNMIDLREDNFVTLLNVETGETREDLSLDVEKNEDHAKIKEAFTAAGGELEVRVTGALNYEQIFPKA